MFRVIAWQAVRGQDERVVSFCSTQNLVSFAVHWRFPDTLPVPGERGAIRPECGFAGHLCAVLPAFCRSGWKIAPWLTTLRGFRFRAPRSVREKTCSLISSPDRIDQCQTLLLQKSISVKAMPAGFITERRDRR